MGGFFGVAAKQDCLQDLFFGTDYHSHLGTQRGGLLLHNDGGFDRSIHDITNAQFRSKFEPDLPGLSGHLGLGVISDYEDQPLIIASHLGVYGIVTVGAIGNLDDLVQERFKRRTAHFSEMSGHEVNPTELVATIINEEDSFEAGIERVFETIEGSCSMLLLTSEGIYAARDSLGRTPVVLGRKEGAYAVTMESCAFPNLDYTVVRELGPGEIVYLTPEGAEQRRPPGSRMQMCAFLWVYYGFPASDYEGINVEAARYRCGAALARSDAIDVDLVAGVPDSGTAHGLGYAHESGIPFHRPFVKYTPTWPRSFMPQDQTVRNLVARMKLIPIRELIDGKRMLFCEDSIVRGTQLRDTVTRLYTCGAREVHMRPACPPLVFGCPFLNFSRSRTELDLAGRRAILELESDDDTHLDDYTDPDSARYADMVEIIRKRLGLTSLRYQRIEDLTAAIGLPCGKLCTHCWTGAK